MDEEVFRVVDVLIRTILYLIDNLKGRIRKDSGGSDGCSKRTYARFEVEEDGPRNVSCVIGLLKELASGAATRLCIVLEHSHQPPSGPGMATILT